MTELDLAWKSEQEGPAVSCRCVRGCMAAHPTVVWNCHSYCGGQGCRLEPDSPGFKSQFCRLLAVCPLFNCLKSLCPHFLVIQGF